MQVPIYEVRVEKFQKENGAQKQTKCAYDDGTHRIQNFTRSC